MEEAFRCLFLELFICTFADVFPVPYRRVPGHEVVSRVGLVDKVAKHPILW